ncbi:MAG: GFA family protein [Burkholderiaceae bacterium]
MKRTFTGSCHCGAVRYEVDLDLSAGTFKCNCSICSKLRNWLAVVQPDAFRLLSDESEIGEYQFGKETIHHLFCKRCGVSSFGWGMDPKLGGRFFAIKVNCLDDATVNELANAPVQYLDGRHDNFRSAPAETRHL